ncbi:unnamed protein product [Thelazia callipaeda]|uniref:Peptidase A1 domain-containing protein n=1 Tax=Thelazia callipaeda TaxID=103827 RepID=A0A0N5CK50_THECL|nr:unnamed protein product [Thelazia callipaeda]
MEIGIGTPAKNFTVLLDTVSSLFWVDTIFTRQPHQFFANILANSSILSSLPSPLDICRLRSSRYYGMQITAMQYKDCITIEQATGQELILPRAPFCLATSVIWNDREDYQGVNGILGLSYLSLLDRNLITKAIYDGRLNQIITVALPKYELMGNGILTIGAIDETLCNSENYNPEFILPTTQKRYEFRYLMISLGNAKFSSVFRTIAYPHIRKPYIAVPHEFMQKIVQNYNAQKNETTGKYMVDCEQPFAPFKLFTARNTFVLDTKYFIIEHEGGNCELAFRTRQGVGNPVVLGIPFLQQYCTVLEPRHKRISFLPIKMNDSEDLIVM